jgi:hypothetical protein
VKSYGPSKSRTYTVVKSANLGSILGGHFF